MNNNELKNTNGTKIEDTSPDNNILYFTYSVICESSYDDIKNDNQIQKYVIGLLLKMRKVINNTKNKHTAIMRLLQQTDLYKNMFPNIKKVQI